MVHFPSFFSCSFPTHNIPFEVAFRYLDFLPGMEITWMEIPSRFSLNNSSSVRSTWWRWRRLVGKTVPVTQQTSGLATSVSVNPGPYFSTKSPQATWRVVFFSQIIPSCSEVVTYVSEHIDKSVSKRIQVCHVCCMVFYKWYDLSSPLLPFLCYILPIHYLCIFKKKKNQTWTVFSIFSKSSSFFLIIRYIKRKRLRARLLLSEQEYSLILIHMTDQKDNESTFLTTVIWQCQE